MKQIILLSALILISSCGDNKLNKVEKLGSFRILAIKTTTPELTQANGLTVIATPFISDISSGGRTITGNVEGCVDPGIAFGAEATCDGNSTRVTSAYSVDTTDAASLNSKWGPDSVPLSIPDAIFTGRSSIEKFNGVPFIIIFSLSADGVTYKSFRRILVTNRTTLNTNPSLTSLLLNSGAMAKPKNGDYFGINYSGTETYDYMRVDGVVESRTEKLVMAWYVSDGTLNISKANATETVQFKSDPPATPLLIIGVLRDERGGVAVTTSLN
jgi:hypothetical protein